jgi:energy-coupling factor transporter ATP-binding protein EcfA2
MATIRRVTIHRLRNVTPGCTFELHPGLNVLLGQNGTGKTTLLQWMADFMSGDLDVWSKEPYSVEVEIEAGVEPDRASLRILVENEISELPRNPEEQYGLDNLVSLMSEPPRASLQTTKIAIAFTEHSYEILERPNHLSLYVNEVRLLESESLSQMQAFSNSVAGLLWKAAVALIPKTDGANEGARIKAKNHLALLVRDLLGTYPLWIDRFDESLGFFHRIVAGPESEAQVVLRASGVSMYRLVPSELRQLIENKFQEAKLDIPTLVFSSEVVQGFLATAVQLFQHRSAALYLDLLEKDEQESQYGNLRFTFHRHDGSIIGHDALSYGQKRMLSFLYYLALHPRFIVVDELVNGLHHAWIEACIEEIGDRQGILTSQNPLLLDHMSFDSADEVRQRFILCRSERQADGRDQLIWRNPTQEEAESFFRAYQAGIQHIGEILVDKGLW